MGKEIIVHNLPKSPVSESIRLLRTNLEFLCENKQNQIFLFTSAAPGDGKSWVTANLAIAYAQSGKNVLITDADLRKGRQHKIFSRYNGNGFSNYLITLTDSIVDNGPMHADLLMRSMVKTEVNNLYLIPSGVVPPNPTELLSSKYIDIFLKIAKANFDIIIFDMPPVSIVADSLVLCKKVDYTILVASADKNMLINAQKSIAKVDGKIAGVVFNKMPTSRRKEYVKYYSHYSDENFDEGNYKKRRK